MDKDFFGLNNVDNLKIYGIDEISTDDIIYKEKVLTDVINDITKLPVKTYNIGRPTASNVIATLYDNGLLDITGTGDIPIYVGNTPWYDDGNNTKIKYIKMSSTVKPTDIDGLFNDCTSLVDISGFIIPDSVTSMSMLFFNCTSLTAIPSTFKIPNSVTSISSLFSNCTSLVDISGLIIPNTVTNISNLFFNCTSLTAIPSTFKIPNSVTSISSLFDTCSKLTDASNLIIPDSVTNINQLFYRCSSLTGTIKLNSSGYSATYTDCFFSCSTISGTKLIVNYTTSIASKIDDIIATKSLTSNISKGILIY